MSSRMEKYHTDDYNIAKRTEKNQELYESVNNSKIEKFSLDSNVAILDDNINNIDVNRIRDILDKKYREEPKRRSIKVEIEHEEEKKDEVKEYDINTILSKARKEKEFNYEQDRLKKLRDTQYDILNSIQLEKEKETNQEINTTEDELMNLINTITSSEMKTESNKVALDILNDLKGSDNTEVLDGVVESVTKDLDDSFDTTDKLKLKDDSFYTESMDIKKEDFEDFEELKKEVKSNKVISTILIVIVLICLLGGLLFILNKVLDLGLF